MSHGIGSLRIFKDLQNYTNQAISQRGNDATVGTAYIFGPMAATAGSGIPHESV